MGYDLHITRAEYWAENDGHEITAAEWLAYVEEDPELTLDASNGDYFAIWSGKSEYPDPWFDWAEGDIYTKNPDDPILEKALSMAKRFNAKVQGDEGEVYVAVGQEPIYE